MKKAIKNSTSVALAMCMGLSMVACGGKEDYTGKCEIKAVIAGYNADWLDEAVKVFNEMYKAEGYEAVVTLKDTELGFGNEMKTPKRNTTDLYFNYTSPIKEMIDVSRSILGSAGGALLEDLTDVYNSKAIGKDKKEQGGAIKERINEFDIKLNRYNGLQSGYDGIYGMPWYGGSAGVYVNKKVLESNGYTLDAFLTSDSVIEVSEQLAPDPEDYRNTDLMFPVAWTGVSSGYWCYWTQTMLAQYMGEEDYYNFYNFIPEGGEDDLIENGWTVYKNRGLYEILRVAEKLTNLDWAYSRTLADDQIAAQARLMNGKALFMVTGDWIYKEMERDYSENLKDIIAVKTPVLSALGVKLGLCGTEHPEPAFDKDAFIEDYSCSACEEKLRAIIKAVDAQLKTDAEIASELSVTETQVATVRERRGYYEDAGGFSALIPSYADQKDVAKLFLRFMASDDGLEIYRRNARANMKIRPINAPVASEMSEIEQAMYEKMYGQDATPIYTKTDNIIRLTCGVSTYPGGGDEKNTFKTHLAYSHYDKGWKNNAKNVYFDSVDIVRGNWSDWLSYANLID